MPRSLWKGAVSFGLITIPVKLYSATEEKDVTFRQVHDADGGRIRYRRICEIDGEEVPYEHIAKGYQSPDGRTVVLTDEDFSELPLTSSKVIEIVEFVDPAQIDPSMFNKSYFLEADGAGAKPYVLLRAALADAGKVGVVKVALRSRETLALVRAHGDVLMLQTMLWPDEVRDGSFAAPSADVAASEAEVAMAKMFIEQLTAEFDPAQFTDSYREALEKVVQSKLAGTPLPSADTSTGPSADEVIDLVAALKASVEAAKKRREDATKAS